MSDTDASSDLSGLGGFFFYVFIIHPCTAWILRPGRFPRQKSIMYAIAFLVAVAAIKSGAYLRLDATRFDDQSYQNVNMFTGHSVSLA
jgi:hypothetical protein